MKTVLLAIVVIILIAAAGVGGYFYGTTQASTSVDIASFDPSQMQPGQFQRGQFDPSTMTQEQLEQLRQSQFGGQGGQGGAGAELFAGGSRGTIESIENGVITVRTEDSLIKVKATDTTLVEKLMSVAVDDLEVGEQITFSGSQNEDGSTAARSIRVLTMPGL